MIFNYHSAMEEKTIRDYLENGEKYPAISKRLWLTERTIATIFYNFRKRNNIANNWQILVCYWKANTTNNPRFPDYLTEKQKSVFAELVFTGDHISQIGLRLGFTERNVQKHIKNILGKTGIDNAQKLIISYWKNQL